jgi:hypothetical protein
VSPPSCSASHFQRITLQILTYATFVFYNISLSFTLISLSLVAKLHFDDRQKDGTGNERKKYRNSELLLKRLGQDFIFLCQIFLGFPLRRKLPGISFELCLLFHTPTGLLYTACFSLCLPPWPIINFFLSFHSSSF